MTEKEIKILMIRKDVRAVDIARKINVHRSWITNVIKGRRPTRRIQQAIADALNKPVEKLFPSYKKAA
jgi:transcriptional regulator with XRE-family HTH domain